MKKVQWLVGWFVVWWYKGRWFNAEWWLILGKCLVQHVMFRWQMIADSMDGVMQNGI